MKRILFCLFLTLAGAGLLRAQESAAQQQMDELNGRIQTLIEGQAAQGKRLDALAREISELREKVNAPQVNDSASHEELRKLARTVQELADKQSADKELILDNLKQVVKTVSDTPVKPGGGKKNNSHLGKNGDNGGDGKTTEPTPAVPQNGYEYEVKSGDSLGLIVKAYRDKGVKVTTAQVLKANPGLDANKLYVGKKIIIPDPTAK
jgi:LysM repeat protein